MKTKRRAHDQYDTPPYLVHAILGELSTTGTILDPCAGVGNILRALDNLPNSYAIELCEERAKICAASLPHGCEVGDALQLPWRAVDLIITNPPFSLALEFVTRALQVSSVTNGTVAMLLRLSFLESQERKKLHEKFPSDVYVFSKRPSFTGKSTDSSTVAWFIWGPGRGGRWKTL